MKFAGKAYLKYCKALKDKNIEVYETYKYTNDFYWYYAKISWTYRTQNLTLRPRQSGLLPAALCSRDSHSRVLGQGTCPRSTHLPSRLCSRHLGPRNSLTQPSPVEASSSGLCSWRTTGQVCAPIVRKRVKKRLFGVGDSIGTCRLRCMDMC